MSASAPRALRCERLATLGRSEPVYDMHHAAGADSFLVVAKFTSPDNAPSWRALLASTGGGHVEMDLELASPARITNVIARAESGTGSVLAVPLPGGCACRRVDRNPVALSAEVNAAQVKGKPRCAGPEHGPPVAKRRASC